MSQNKKDGHFSISKRRSRKRILPNRLPNDHIEQGLICVFSVLEPCRTFSFRTEKGKPFVASRGAAAAVVALRRETLSKSAGKLNPAV